MSTNQMEDVRKLFLERLGGNEIDENKALKDLGLDSLDIVEMCLDLEDKFGIEFSPDELGDIKTVGDLFASIEKKFVD